MAAAVSPGSLAPSRTRMRTTRAIPTSAGANTLARSARSSPEAIVERGLAAGELRPDPDKVFGLALVGMARALVVRAVEGGTEPGRAADALLELFLAGAAPGSRP